jgi:hypothetical protein
MDVLEKRAEIEKMQAELQAELTQIKEQAEQAEEIKRAKMAATRFLIQDKERVDNKNYWVNKRFSETDNANVKVNTEAILLERKAKSWKIEDSKVLATYTEKVTKLSLVYVNPITLNEYEIRVDEDGKMELPYTVADTYRSYTRIKTVVNKIVDYIESQNTKARLRNSQEEANTEAVAHLTELYPDSTVKYEKGWKSNYGRRGGGYDVHRVMVIHPNGNTVTMNVGYSSKEVFTLSCPTIRFNKELSALNILDIAQSA